ncbi:MULTISPECIES: stage II sporulation protein M [unclassified Archaeoglobus]|uniref:stage II sporulation protein M n=1 Tax=unclassified Archaeoglobus TaxID=2643606 RepID=UPI0025BBD1C3|nr:MULTISPECIES: stage II sporulation protein M [unclassified Archaeoglobus]
MKKLILISIIIYLAGFIAGYSLEPIGRQNYKQYIVKNDPTYSKIVKNNLYVITCEMFGGTTLLPLVYSLFFSGFALGLILKNLSVVGLNLKNCLLLTLSHGIFEIPAIIIAGAAGFKIPYEILRYLAGKKEQILTQEDIREYLTLALISIILIVIAAWIEANITLEIAKAMLNSS